MGANYEMFMKRSVNLPFQGVLFMMLFSRGDAPGWIKQPLRGGCSQRMPEILYFGALHLGIFSMLFFYKYCAALLPGWLHINLRLSFYHNSPKRMTLKPKPYTLNLEPETLNFELQTSNFKPRTINDKPETLNLEPWTSNLELRDEGTEKGRGGYWEINLDYSATEWHVNSARWHRPG